MKKYLFILLVLSFISVTAMAQIDESMLMNNLPKNLTPAQVAALRARYAQQAEMAKPAAAVVEVNRQRDAMTQQEENAVVSETLQEPTPAETKANSDKVFGRDIFRTKGLTFEPSVNIATPQNYRLGPGDEVIVDVWGASEATITQKISPDGYITIPDVGPVNLNGLTVQSASERIKSHLAKIYAGLSAANVSVGTNALVTLGQIRTIQVNVMGEAANPGTYAVSSFATVFHALYKAGGVSNLGSLRNIKVVRGGRTVAVVDVYDYILHGKSATDVRLQDGDMILVPVYETLVKAEGIVKRPMFYEMKQGEPLSALINYAGGFASRAYTRSVTIERNDGTEKSVATVSEDDFINFKLQDGDKLTVGGILERYSNRVELTGAVYRPGYYEIGSQIQTVLDLITTADGALEDAFLNHAVLHRVNDDKTLTVIPVDLKGILNHTVADIPLYKNDVLFVPSIYDLTDQGTIEVLGEVTNPGEFPFTHNTKIEDIIIKAGGLKESASVVRVDVSRRITDKNSTKKQKKISQNFSFGIKDGFVIDGEAGFLLQPYDQVFVRRSPGYVPQINVNISGEVEFEGDYSLSIRNERLSDVINKAGGISDFAYVKGARLERKMTEQEKRQAKEMLEVIKLQNAMDGDSIKISDDDIGDVYSVAIDLESALANPHSEADIALRDGDRIVIPQYNNTITVRGNVRKQNTITYDPKKSLSYYIGEAGGYADRTKKSGTFIIYPNGHIKELGRRASASEIEPGSEIIVPSKQKSTWNPSSAVGMISSSVSMLAILATLINNLK